LKLLLNSDDAFKKYAKRLVEKTKRDEEDVAFRNTMDQVYSKMMDPSEQPLPDDTNQEFDNETMNSVHDPHQNTMNLIVARKTDSDAKHVSGFMGLAYAWGLIPVSSKREILKVIPKLITQQQVVLAIDEVVGFVDKVGGKHVMVALAAISLGYDAIKNLCRWWRGEITGARCCKNIVDSVCTIGAGVAGGVLGAAALGALVGPLGAMAGGIIGGAASSQLTSLLIDKLTQSLFGIPKGEALENAYNFFGVKMTASNNEINSAFRKLCLKHHPDKGGKSEDFLLVQINMGVIKLARGGVF
jgi:hypothetical protein